MPVDKYEAMYKDLKDLIEDVEYLYETGMTDTPNPIPSGCQNHFKFFKAMVKATYNKAKRLRTKWIGNSNNAS